MIVVKWLLQWILPEHLACEDPRFQLAGKNAKIAHSMRILWFTSGFE